MTVCSETKTQLFSCGGEVGVSSASDKTVVATDCIKPVRW